MNAFDFIVTVALGSTLATVLLNKSVVLAAGVLALFLLIGLQYIITYLAARSKAVSRLVKSTPTLLLYKGQLLEDSMLKERVNQDEIYAIIRKKGLSSIAEAAAVVLETDGSLTVVKELRTMESETMQQVKKPLGPD